MVLRKCFEDEMIRKVQKSDFKMNLPTFSIYVLNVVTLYNHDIQNVHKNCTLYLGFWDSQKYSFIFHLQSRLLVSWVRVSILKFFSYRREDLWTSFSQRAAAVAVVPICTKISTGTHLDTRNEPAKLTFSGEVKGNFFIPNWRFSDFIQNHRFFYSIWR